MKLGKPLKKNYVPWKSPRYKITSLIATSLWEKANISLTYQINDSVGWSLPQNLKIIFK